MAWPRDGQSVIAFKPYISFSPFHFLFSAFSPICRPHISVSLQQILTKVCSFIKFYMINRAKAVFLGVYQAYMQNITNCKYCVTSAKRVIVNVYKPQPEIRLCLKTGLF